MASLQEGEEMTDREKKIKERLRELWDGFESYNLNYVLHELEHIEDMVFELSEEENEDEKSYCNR